MQSTARTALALVSLALFLAVRPAPAEPFSRSRWIAERSGRMRFSGGVLPAGRERLLARLRATAEAGPESTVEATGEESLALRRRIAGALRVSSDLLAPDGSAAQPETQAEPFLAADPANEMRQIAGYQEGRFADGGARALTYAWTANGGRSWREGLLPGVTQAAGGSYERASDPWVAFGPEGRAYYASLAFDETTPRNGIYLSASPDGGRSWGEPVAVHLGSANEFDDKESVTVDTRADSPFRGRVYVGWDTGTSAGLQILRLASSDDGGETFGAPVEISRVGIAIGIVVLVGPGGVVYAVWLGQEGPDVAVRTARSEDGGASWSAPLTIATTATADVDDLRVGEGLPAAAVEARTGELAVVWQDSRFTPGRDQIVLAGSSDGGATWSAPRRISDGPGDAPAFTPAVAYNGQNGLAVTYYTLRNDPARHFFVDEYAVVSRNRGRTFRRSVRLSGISWDVRFAAMAGGFFLGDYQGLAAGRRTFYALWIATFEPSRLAPPARQPDAYTRTLQP